MMSSKTLRSKYPFMWVDAFTNHSYAGNPCAIVFETDAFTDETMQKIAQEFLLPETAFVSTSNKADFRVRYFTPEQEIPLAGHPTIATTYALIDSGRYLPKPGKNRLLLELKEGPIEVEVLYESGTVKNIVMCQRKPIFLKTYEKTDILPIFHLDENDLLPGVPIQTVSTGTPMLMVPVKNIEVLKKIELHFSAYRTFHKSADFFSPHFFCLGGFTKEGTTFARHLNVPPDTVEDAFTGSATGCMGAYLWKYQLIQKPRFVAEQGHLMGRPGQATVEIVGSFDEIQLVKVGGQAARVLVGDIEV